MDKRLTCEQLYELIWSTPATKAATQPGFSVTALETQ
jgi:hypothetical protein